jgi:hypothetical protein
MSDFWEEKTMLAVNLFPDVLNLLKTKYKVGDEVNSTQFFIVFRCGDFASRKIIEMLEDFGYVSPYYFDGVPRKVIRLPEEGGNK